jgi:hypothetical protein
MSDPTTEDATTTPETKTEVWTYRGRRRWHTRGKDRTLYIWSHPGDADHDATAEHGYAKQVAQGAYVGARYRVTVSADGSSYYTGGDKRPVLLTDEDQADPGIVAEWQAADRAAGIEADLESLRRRHGEEIDGLAEALLPIKRLLYDRPNRSTGPDRRRRAAIIAAVLSELDRW